MSHDRSGLDELYLRPCPPSGTGVSPSLKVRYSSPRLNADRSVMECASALVSRPQSNSLIRLFSGLLRSSQRPAGLREFVDGFMPFVDVTKTSVWPGSDHVELWRIGVLAQHLYSVIIVCDISPSTRVRRRADLCVGLPYVQSGPRTSVMRLQPFLSLRPTHAFLIHILAYATLSDHEPQVREYECTEDDDAEATTVRRRFPRYRDA